MYRTARQPIQGAGVNPSGQIPPRGDVTNRGQVWKFLWCEDFNTPTAVGSWGAAATADAPPSSPYYKNFTCQPDGTSDPFGGKYTPSQVLSTSNSCLDIFLHTSGGICMSANVRQMWHYGTGNYDNFDGLLYGRWSLRFQCDYNLTGFKSVPLLWPKSEVWPRDGEIDWPEASLGGASVFGTMHHQGGVGGADQDQYSASARLTDWHTYTVEWIPSRCSFYLDSVLVGESTTLIPNTPMYPSFQFTPDGSPPGAGVSGHVSIDWSALWST